MTDKQKPEAITDGDLDAASGGGGSHTLNYEKIEWTYRPLSPSAAKGKKTGNVETTWKIEEGVK